MPQLELTILTLKSSTKDLITLLLKLESILEMALTLSVKLLLKHFCLFLDSMITSTN